MEKAKKSLIPLITAILFAANALINGVYLIGQIVTTIQYANWWYSDGEIWRSSFMCIALGFAFIANAFMAVVLFLKKKGILLIASSAILTLVNIFAMFVSINFKSMFNFDYWFDWDDFFWNFIFFYLYNTGLVTVIFALASILLLVVVLANTLKPFAKIKPIVTKLWFIPGALFLLGFICVDGVAYFGDLIYIVIGLFDGDWNFFESVWYAIKATFVFVAPLLGGISAFGLLPLYIMNINPLEKIKSKKGSKNAPAIAEAVEEAPVVEEATEVSVETIEE